MEKINNCAIYTRVSTNIQAKKEQNSCEIQDIRLRKYIESKENYEYYKTYTDAGFTGSNLKRPALQEMLKDIELKKINIVISYKIDRLTRSIRDFYTMMDTFKKYNVTYISHTENFETTSPNGRLFLNIILTFAQFSKELTSERVSDHFNVLFHTGDFTVGKVAYGYKKVFKKNSRKKKLVIDIKKSKIVKEIYSQYISGKNQKGIINYLNNKKIKTNYNKQWDSNNMTRLLKQPLYAGLVGYKGELIQGKHAPIISLNTWKKAQERRKDRMRQFKSYRYNIFSVFMYCGKCKSKILPMISKHKKPYNSYSVIYICCGRRITHPICDTLVPKARKIDYNIFIELIRISKEHTNLKIRKIAKNILTIIDTKTGLCRYDLLKNIIDKIYYYENKLIIKTKKDVDIEIQLLWIKESNYKYMLDNFETTKKWVFHAYGTICYNVLKKSLQRKKRNILKKLKRREAYLKRIQRTKEKKEQIKREREEIRLKKQLALIQKQTKFCEYYATTKNATHSHQKSYNSNNFSYAISTSRTMGIRILKNPKVKKEIKKLLSNKPDFKRIRKQNHESFKW